jgi:lipoate-protein ligase A
MEKSTWRLLKTKPATGPWNMAFDEALIRSVGEMGQLPTIRLYAWDPPCISLGYAQSASDIDLKRMEHYKYDLVRRPSGGRAILHTSEITYSVAAPNDEARLSGGIIESYRRISEALVTALKLLGVNAQADNVYEIPDDVDKKGPICFEVPSNYEITYQKKKLLGSAQVRRKEGILQHGTLPLNGDLSRIVDVLNLPDETRRKRTKEKMLTRATNLEAILNRQIHWEEASLALEKAFRSSLNLDFIPSEPTDFEMAETERLLSEKYLNDEWTLRI